MEKGNQMIPTSNFEAVKVAIKQDRTGYVLTLSIHPDDISEDVLRDFVGARYQVVMVRIDDQEQPMKRKQDSMVTKSAVLCRSPQFWEWLVSLNELTPDAVNEADAAETVHRMLAIKSRSDLATDAGARTAFGAMMAEYEAWKVGSNAPPF